MHLLHAVLPFHQHFLKNQSTGLIKEGGSPETVMLALTVIPVTTASDNKKGYFHSRIALSLFVMDFILFFFWLSEELLSSFCLSSSLSHIIIRDCCMGNREDLLL